MLSDGRRERRNENPHQGRQENERDHNRYR